MPRDCCRPAAPSSSSIIRIAAISMPIGAPSKICQNATVSPSNATVRATSLYGTASPSCFRKREDSALRLAADERLGPRQGLVIGELLGRALHVIARWAGQDPADLAVERQLRAADRIDDDPGRVWRIPHFELQFDIQRHIAEGRAFKPDVAPF